jgi:hypothetical protein
VSSDKLLSAKVNYEITFSLFFLSFTANATDWRGVYEGVELYKDKEVQGLSYQFLDLRKSIGFYLYDADIADDEKGLECKIQTDAIVWTT